MINRKLGSLLFFLTIFWGHAAAAPIVFSGFNMEANGSATETSGILRLTPAANSQTGSAFISTPFSINSSTSFNTYFQFRIHSGNGADGLTFILQNAAAAENALGAGGGNLGYAGINNSIAVEFDTFFNSSWDPNNNHTGINLNGSVTSIGTSTGVPNLDSGSSLFVWVDYDALSDLLEVYVASVNTKPNAPVLFATVDLTLVGPQAYVGFSAATGGLNNVHDIEVWSFATAQGETIPVPTLSVWALVILALLLPLVVARRRAGHTGLGIHFFTT